MAAATGQETRARPNAGPWIQRLRLWSGLVLFSFVLLHFLNHALGIVSVEWMSAGQRAFRFVWRSAPGTALLISAALTHAGLGLWRIAQRRTARMPLWEAVQIGLVLFIPYQLVGHVLSTRAIYEVFGINITYVHELSILWPSEVFNQTVLLAVVWVHGVMGLHFWLRLRPWYRRWFVGFLTLAVLIPALAQWGWVDAARRLALTGEDTGGFSPEQYFWLVDQITIWRWVSYALLAAAFAVPVGAWFARRFHPTVAVTYPGGMTVRATKGQTLLEISRANGIPHASVCGGRARCSTCRTLIVDHESELPPVGEAEQKVLDRIEADGRVRLACQLRPDDALTVQPLLPAGGALALAGAPQDAYHWGVERPAVIMFADLRNFTALSEERLPYDVVFLLNRYLSQMSAAIEEAGGQVDKFIGDGIMAIFGITDDLRTAARQAVEAAAGMADALDALNREIETSGVRLVAGIGVHAGPVILGRIGAAGGKEQPPITALGDTVNAASRLESATKELAAFLVVSAGTLKAAGIDSGNARHATITVKGRRKPLDVVAIDNPRLLLGRPEPA